MTVREDQNIPVIEIFGPTIQGEGVMCGHQTYFVRFGGCDYRCAKCDSMHAVDGESIRQLATYMNQDEVADLIIDKITSSGGPRKITFSGGNPCLWELGKVMDRLHDHRIFVALETQGTYYKDWVSRCDVVTVSPKGPGMGEKFMPKVFLEFLADLKYHPGLNIKVVVFSVADLQFAIDVKELLNVNGLNPPFYLSQGNNWPPGQDSLTGENPMPITELRQLLLMDMRVMSEEILQDKRCHDFIYLPQMHVLIWGNKQGV